MAEYQSPLREMQFVVNELNHFDQFAAECGYDLNAELVSSIFEEAAKFSTGVLSPLNPVGDKQGARWEDGKVITSPGWKDAYQQFCQGGWNGISLPEKYGGQGLPALVSSSIGEMITSANMAFGLGPLLTTGAVNALLVCASDDLKNKYLPKMVSGEWTGTMNLTEPQAGSDLAAVRTKAEPQPDGTYKVSGQKIFITYGDHDMTENIVHLVLARLPDAPSGVKGISLFLVPKFIVNVDGSLGAANDVRCVSIEHKLGIHGSPTCVLAFGDNGGAVGYLLGEANRGLEYMFVMMNEARFGVGMQGIALSERSYQLALDYANERTQGRDIANGQNNVAIVHHPDVARLLNLVKVQTNAARMLAAHTASLLDRAHRLEGEAAKNAMLLAELLIPIVKGWSTERGIENTSHAMQVCGGMGYIEETGAAQFYRDVRIAAIYEGTTAIQANDLIGRKLARDSGQTLKILIEEMLSTAAQLNNDSSPKLIAIGRDLQQAAIKLAATAENLGATLRSNIKRTFAGSVPFLMAMGEICGAWQMAKAALLAQQKIDAAAAEQDFYQAKVNQAVFYFAHLLPLGIANLKIAADGGEALLELM